ncbi:MAG: hypothetical protein AMK70_07355 [Nitrospira bacterium SG8_35_1]|nr:MAG: hypothetical protein AMK70_07355 [Nitrospira bacterium SG8_35_1]
MIRDFLSGITYLFQGFQLIRQPALRRFVLFPVLINTIVFSLAITVGVYQFDIFLDWVLPQGNSWWIETTRTVIWIFFTLLVLFILYFTFTILANLIASPFNGLLSEKVEEFLAGRPLKNSGSVKSVIASVLPSFMSEFKKIAYFMLLGGTTFLILLIPGLNALAPILWLFFTSWMMSLEYIAYPMENHNMFFATTRTRLKSMRALSLGFGMAVMFCSMVPLINFVIMPAAVCGATALWLERCRLN